MAVLLTAWLFYASVWILRMPILVHGQGKPRFRDEPRKKYSAYVGRSIKLKCPVSGTDAHLENRTLVAWFKKTNRGMDIIYFHYGNWTRFLKKSEKHLKILNVMEKDAGTYVCIAKNEYGSATLTVELKVKGTISYRRGKPPKFKGKSPKSRKVIYKTGETAKLHCHSTGDPDPNVQWFKDGKSYGVDKRASIGADGWTLNLRYLTVEDTGDYTCRVSNNVGSINRTFTVVVKARILKPIIEEPEVDRLTARQGRSVKFECKATSVGILTFDWKWSTKHDNRSIDLKTSKLFGLKYISNYTKTHEVSMNQFYFDGFLVIRHVRIEDEGKYTCIVRNSYGFDEVDFHLRVRKKEKPPTATPVATKGKVQTREAKIPIVLVAVLTASIVVAMTSFIVLLIMYCRKQRKDLEKQYVIEYQPQGVFQPYGQQMSVHQEMQNVGGSRAGTGNETECAQESRDVLLQASEQSIGVDSRQINEPSSSSEMYLANSRTSLQTTLCGTFPRETSLDKSSAHHSLQRNMPGVQNPSRLPRGDSSPGVSTTDGKRKWDSQSSLDDTPRNTSPQRSRESIV